MHGGRLFDSLSMEGTQGTNDVSGKKSILCPLIVGRQHVKARRSENMDD